VLSDAIDGLPQKPEWVGLQAVGRVESTRWVGDKTTTDYRYYPDFRNSTSILPNLRHFQHVSA
jgi:hypothetical protein